MKKMDINKKNVRVKPISLICTTMYIKIGSDRIVKELGKEISIRLHKW